MSHDSPYFSCSFLDEKWQSFFWSKSPDDVAPEQLQRHLQREPSRGSCSGPPVKAVSIGKMMGIALDW